jgi:hypothetical protein
MDPNDAVLEQLKRAQKRGLEAVTNRLDFVLESLDELIKEAKASVQEALPQEAEELFPLAEVEVAVAALQERLSASEQRAEDLAARIVDLEAELDVARSRPSGAVTTQLLRELDAARSQSELLRELLPLLTAYVGRAAVLVIRGGSLSAWSGIGFSHAEALRHWQADVDASSVFARFAAEGTPLAFDPSQDPVMSLWLASEPASEEGRLLPVCLRGKTVGAIYVDRTTDRPWEPEVAQGLVALASWLIDTLHYRPTVPSPALAEFATAGTGEEPAEGPEETTGQEAEPAAELQGPGAEPEEVEESEAVAETEVVSEPEPAEVDEVAVEPEVDEVAVETEVDEVTVEPVEPMEAEIEEEESAAASPETEIKEPEAEEHDFDSEYDPSATMRVEPPEEMPAFVPTLPETPSPAAAPEEDARFEEARRFARLLVSEIKLYNEDDVERGRASRDLYQRLKDDIDRSREMYEKRIPSDVRESRDYFREELVRILADGDPDALGM